MGSRTFLAALGTILGLQTLRAFFPLLVYVLKDRQGLSSPALGGVAFGIFALAFFLPAAAARLGSGALPRLALALAVIRAALQTWEGDPAFSLALAALGTVAFLGFLGALSRGDAGANPRVTGFLTGLLADAALHALFGTRDLHWGGPWANPAAGLLVGLTLATAWALRNSEPVPDGNRNPPPVSLAAWGPFLCLHLELLGNVARLSARLDRPSGESGALLCAGLAAALLVGRNVPRGFGAGAVLVAMIALACGVLAADATGAAAVATLLLTQVGAAALLARALAAVDQDERPVGRSASAFGFGFLLFLAFLFAHYAGYDLGLPLSRIQIFFAAGAALALVSSGARNPQALGRPPGTGALLMIAIPLVCLPLARPRLFPTAAPGEDPSADRLRAVSFNLHAGFDERGGWSFDREMDALVGANPDVVALQEVSRGWVINGCADLFELARERLGMPGVAAPSVRSDWGNAIFVRHEAATFENLALPPPGLPIPRAVGVATVPLGGEHTLRVLATHFHHPDADDSVRVQQAGFVAGLSDPRHVDAALLLGDFNALPDSECLEVLRVGGWRDVGRSEGDAAGATFPSAAPERRIDTILYRGSLRLEGTDVAPPWGSDHRAVIADFAFR
ncbi:MAG: endonuclease/exonuclease/phosphatase family protein [Candidatus Eiseniibacteriota bacterium]